MQTRFQVFVEQFQSTRVTEVLKTVSKREVSFIIAFTLECEYRVWTHRNAAINHACQVDAKKGHRGIWNRIDQMINYVVMFGGEAEILATERADFEVWFYA